jgi:hypothetical protein
MAKLSSKCTSVCALQEDLEIIFSRFGRVVDCAVIRDFKTGDSLCYGKA